MAYKIACVDSGANCPGSFTTETKEELMAHIQVHATTAHPEMDAPPPEAIEALIKKV